MEDDAQEIHKLALCVSMASWEQPSSKASIGSSKASVRVRSEATEYL